MTCACDDHQPDHGASRRAVGRRTLLAGGFAAGLTPLVPGWFTAVGAQDGGEIAALDGSEEGYDPPVTRDFGFLPPRPASEIHQRNIMFPVLPDATLGKATWTDTYLAPRSNGRKHEGQDLMGKKMLKLLACVDGTIVELRHQAAGNSLYLKGTDGYYYCYLHINNDTPGTDNASNLFANAFAPGLKVGSVVKRGQHLAFLGDSGNAEATGAHCHFEIRLPNAKWYNAAACNAKYSLQAAQPASMPAPVPPSAFAPASGAVQFAQRQADDFLGAVPSTAWLYTSADNLANGRIGLDAFIEAQLATTRVQAFTNPVIRLYLAYFGGVPAFDGVNHWIRQCRSGITLDAASAEMARSSKFRTMWGTLSNREFARRIHLNLNGGAEPSASVLNGYAATLDGGTTRGAFVRQRCENAAYRSVIGNKVRVLTIYHAMVRRSPDAYWWNTWAERDRTDRAAMATLIRTFRTGPVYRARFG